MYNPNITSDIHINGLYLDISMTRKYTLKCIRTDLHLSNIESTDYILKQIVAKKCKLSPIFDFPEKADWEKSLRCLYGIAEVLSLGYEIENEEWQSSFIKYFSMVKWVFDLYRFDTFTNEPEKYKFYINHFRYIESIDNLLKKYCFDHIAKISITLAPLNITRYVQLWILEHECPISICIPEYSRIECLEKIEYTINEIEAYKRSNYNVRLSYQK